jgi:ATP-dependent helicase HrpB
VLTPLPVDSAIDEIRASLQVSRAAVVVAAPGAGKTTRIPPRLTENGPVVLLQPRRAAARAIAQRIAFEQQWTIGREVGWHVRFDRRFGPDTRLLVATEGILTARLQSDPLLSGFTTVVIDEFHERSIHADLALALARQAWLARPDLRIVVMSATLDARPVAAFLDNCPVIVVDGTLHPLAIEYAPGRPVEDAVSELLTRSTGDVLCFQPGAAEIARAVSAIEARVPNSISVLLLHGGLGGDEQDRALTKSPASGRRIVVATNIAETSVTVPDVHAVVDAGLQKVARYDATRGIDSLSTERISADAADQRAGRAGRLGPGLVLRLWSAQDRLRPHREPDIHRVDLCSTILDLVAWGGKPDIFEWFEAPRPDAVGSAMALLERLGAMENGVMTDSGRQMQRLPLHPRLARILIARAGRRELVRACALLSERTFLPARAASTTSDLLSALDDWPRLPPHLDRAARDIERVIGNVVAHGDSCPMTDDDFRRAILAGYPDRVAQRREPSGARLKLSSGAGAVLGPESGVRSGEFLVALDVRSSNRPNDPDSVVRMASVVDRAWLEPTAIERIHRVGDDGRIRALEIERYDALVLAERPVEADAAVAAEMLAAAWLGKPRSDEDARLLLRLRFAGVELDLKAAVQQAAYGVRSVADIDLAAHLDHVTRQRIDRDAPAMLPVPSGRSVRLDYQEDGSVSASVKLQELFGLADTPRIGPNREPVLFALLSPGGRPVQMTRDLRSFWDRTYPEVRKELRGRYPRHPWPEDPWNAMPTARPKPRR